MSSTSTNHERDPSSHIQDMASPDDGRIPSPRTSFVGREAAVSTVQSQIRRDSSRLVTIVGPGGVGKTRVAIEVARDMQIDFPHGVWFVSLAAIQDTRFVIDTIAGALSVNSAGAADMASALEAFLGDRRVLLILDNMEHLPEAVIVVDRLLGNCPGLVVLATSRAPLRLSGERISRLDPMTLPAADESTTLDALLESEAGRLFIERAQSVQAGIAFSDTDVEAIAAMCVRLDGLPLAIELAASRTRNLTPTNLLRRLDRSLSLLTSGPHDAPVRQQTLRDTIAWSYDLLPEHQQALFRRLAICLGGFTFAAANALSSKEPRDLHANGDQVFDDVCSLLDNSLIVRISGPGEEPRFSMLETIREYGLAKLQENSEEHDAYARHARFYQALVYSLRPEIEGRAGRLTLDTFEAEHANLRQALSWFLEQHDIEHAVRLTRDLWKFWWVRQHLSEGRMWMERALALAGDDTLEGVAEILYAAGSAALGQGDVDEATRCVQRGLAIAEAVDDRDWMATHYYLLARIVRHKGDLDRVYEILEQGIALSRMNDPPGSIGEHRTAMMLDALADNLYERGDVERALDLAEEAHAIWERRGDSWGLALALSTIAELAASAGDLSRAIADKRECLRLFHGIGDLRGCAGAINDLAILAVRTRQPSVAIRLFGAVEAIREAIGADGLLAARADRQALEASARVEIGARFAELAWNEGKALSLDQAVEEALALAIPTAKASGRTRAKSSLDLTRRELDVLRLVVTGATDNQIADTLFIASRTVTSHMTSILTKLNVENRTAAAALATRTGLV